MAYEYDKTDNINIKRDLTNDNMAERYDYDDFNRLVASSSIVDEIKFTVTIKLIISSKKTGGLTNIIPPSPMR